VRLYDFLDYFAGEPPDREFAVQAGGRQTYAEAQVEANRLANAFVAAGVRPGERVALLSKNSIEYVLLYFAASKAGVVLVPLNYRLSPGGSAILVTAPVAALLFAAYAYLATVDAIRT